MKNRIDDFNKGGMAAARAPRAVLQYAAELVKDGMRGESVNYLRDTIKEYPADVYLPMNASVTLTKLGDEMQRAGEFSFAEEYWKYSFEYAMYGLNVKSDDVRLLSQAAKNLRNLGNYEASESFYLRAICLDDRDKFTWSAMGELYARWAEQPGGEDPDDLLQDAIDCYAEAHQLDTDDQLTLTKMNDLASRGYTASREGFGIEDYDLEENDALDIIAQYAIVDPADLPVIPFLHVAPASRRDHGRSWKP